MNTHASKSKLPTPDPSEADVNYGLSRNAVGPAKPDSPPTDPDAKVVMPPIIKPPHSDKKDKPDKSKKDKGGKGSKPKSGNQPIPGADKPPVKPGSPKYPTPKSSGKPKPLSGSTTYASY